MGRIIPPSIVCLLLLLSSIWCGNGLVRTRTPAFTLRLGRAKPNWRSNANIDERATCSAHARTSVSMALEEVNKQEDKTARTRRIIQSIGTTGQTGGAGGTSTYEGLVRLDEFWSALKEDRLGPPPKIVHTHTHEQKYTEPVQFDAVVCGGTLGIFFALALMERSKGRLRVAVLERGSIKGRAQEWNISRLELEALIKTGILTEQQLSEAINIEFNPIRAGFKAFEDDPLGFEIYVRDVLNLGVSPEKLIDIVKRNFVSKGGTVFEGYGLEEVHVYDNAVEISSAVKQGDSNARVKTTSRLLLDCMGSASPITKQIRNNQKPDGICIVVGSCARGYKAERNTFADVIYANSPITDKNTSKLQYFWEAFPAGSGPEDRTTYMFTYADANKLRPAVTDVMNDYWDLLEDYQGVSIDDLEFLRVVYGVFATYKDSPLRPHFDRILQVGDASGIQSPLSFGGFGGMTRHLDRIVGGLSQALDCDLLTKEDLKYLNPYQPNLSATWMFQRSMSVPVERNPIPEMIVNLLASNFKSMASLGDKVTKPFLQDVVQFSGLAKTLTLTAIQKPLTVFIIWPHVGTSAMLDFFNHFISMGVYAFLNFTVGRILFAVADKMNPGRVQFRVRQVAEAWKYGSGGDYHDL